MQEGDREPSKLIFFRVPMLLHDKSYAYRATKKLFERNDMPDDCNNNHVIWRKLYFK